MNMKIQYSITWCCRILDNLPVAVPRQRQDGSQSTTYEHGFRVGFKGKYAGVSAVSDLSDTDILILSE